MKRFSIAAILLLALLGSLSATIVPLGPHRFSDDDWRIYDGTTPSKMLAFEVSAISEDTTRTWTVPDRDLDLGSPTFYKVIVDSVEINGETICSPAGDLYLSADSSVYLTPGGPIYFKPSLDTTDFIMIRTLGDVPEITTEGNCNLKITADGGTIIFDDEIRTGTGASLAASYTATGTVSGTTLTDGTFSTTAGLATWEGGGLQNFTMVEVGSLTDSTKLDKVNRLYVSGGYIYAVAYEGANTYFTILDPNIPANPIIVGSLTAGIGNVDSIWVAGKYVYTANSDTDTFVIIDISNPSSPSIAGTVAIGTDFDLPAEIMVEGKYAYVVAYGSDALSIIDISDPTTPVEAGNTATLATLNGAHGVYVVGDYAYVAASIYDGFTVVDISDPTTPAVVGTVTDAQLNGAGDVEVRGRFAYVTAEAGDYLTIVNIKDPTTPTIIGSVTDGTNLDGVDGIHLMGNYAICCSTTGDKLTLVDISDPTAPAVVGTPISIDGDDVYVSGRYAYVANEAADTIKVYRIVGIEVPTASIGDLQADVAHVRQYLDVGHQLNVHGAANIGYNLFVDDDIFANGTIGCGAITTSGQMSMTGGATGAAPTPQMSFLTNYYDNAGDASISHIDLGYGQFGFGLQTGTLVYTSAQYHKFYDNDDLANPVFTIDGATGNAIIAGTLGAGAITGTSLTIPTTGEINFRDTDISIGSTLFDGVLDMSADISIDMFYDNADVGDGVDGQSLNINRRAGEGDDWISLYVDKDRKGLIGFSGDDDLLQLAANALTVNGTIGCGAITSTGAVEGTTLTDGTFSTTGGSVTGLTIGGAWTVAGQTCADLGTVTLAALGAGCTQAEWDAANAHITESGASHTYIDQAVTVAGTPQFANLGIEAVANAAKGIYIAPSPTDTYSGIDVTYTFAPSAAGKSGSGMVFTVYAGNVADDITTMAGCSGAVGISNSGYSGTIATAAGYRAALLMYQSGATITDAYLFRGTAWTKVAGTITTGYGLYLPAVSATTPYAIYTAGASSDTYLEGSISALDVTDRAQWSAWQGTSKEALGAVLAIDKNGDHTSYPASIKRTFTEQRPTGEKRIELVGGVEVEVDVTEGVEVSGRSLSAMVTMLVESVKELKTEIETLKAATPVPASNSGKTDVRVLIFVAVIALAMLYIKSRKKAAKSG